MSGRRTLPESYGPASPPTPVPEVLPPEAAPSVRGVRVLIAAAQRPGRDRLASVLAEAGARCLQTGDPAEIDSLVRAHRVEVVLVPCSGGAVEALDLCARLAAGPANPSVVIAPESPTLDVALAAVRAGASDLVAWGAPAGELITRISAAAGSAARRPRPGGCDGSAACAAGSTRRGARWWARSSRCATTWPAPTSA